VESCSPYPVLKPCRSVSWLVFVSGSLFSANLLSVLGRRLDATDGLRDTEVLLGTEFSERSFGGMESTRLGSVSSLMSERGRIFAQEVTLAEIALGSPKTLLTIPPQPMTWVVVSDPGDNAALVVPSVEQRSSEGWPFPGGGCEKPDPFSIRSAKSEKVKASIPSAGRLRLELGIRRRTREG
jgi:hypothetical protein